LGTKNTGAYYNFGIAKGQVAFAIPYYLVIIKYRVIIIHDSNSRRLHLLPHLVIFSTIQAFEFKSVREIPAASKSPYIDLVAVKLIGGDATSLPLVALHWQGNKISSTLAPRRTAGDSLGGRHLHFRKRSFLRMARKTKNP
jgi:hypothetical protein